MPETSTGRLSVKDLATLVKAMRAAQKTYFRTRAQGDLNESKRLERALDQAVEDTLNPPAPMLFD